MFKRIQRIGSVPCKFQYALVLKDLQLSLPLDGMDIQTIWTRGPHRCKSISAQSKGDGTYQWSFEEQKKQPMMLNCTLYKKDGKEKDKDKNSTSSFQSKPCKITIKHVIDNGQKTRTIGEITVDLADHAVEKVHSQDFSMKVDGTKNIDATLSFTLHSRPLVGTSAASTETVSTIEGMDQSYLDTDSVADFGTAKVNKKKTIGLDSESDEDDDDLEDPDGVMGGFGAAGAKKAKDEKKANPFESDDSSDDDKPVAGGFGRGATTTTTTTTGSKSPDSTPTKRKDAISGNSLVGDGFRDKYKDDDIEVSRNSRPSRLTGAFAKSSGSNTQDKERLKQLESQAIKADYQREQMEEKLARAQNELKKEKDRSHSLEQELNLHDRNTKEIVDGIVLEWSTKVAELHVETKSLKSRISELELQHEQRLRDAVANVEEESKRILSVSQDEATQLKREVEQLRGRKLAFDEMLETMKLNYKHKLPEELKILQLQIKYYERQLVEADLTIDCVRNTYQSTNSVLMNEVKGLEEAKQHLKAALSEAAHTNNQLHQHNVVLETQCKKHSESRIKMSEILNSMEVLLSEKEEKLTGLTTENDELKLELLKVKKQLHRFQQGE